MRLLLILISLVLLGCSRRTVELDRHTSDQRLKQSSDSSAVTNLKVRSTNKKVVLSDHRYGYRVTIEPDGEFVLDKNGFRGKAKNITAEGNGSILQNIAEHSDKKTDSAGKVDLKKNTEEKKSESSKSKNTKNDGGNFLILIIIGLAVYFIIKAIWGK